MPGQCAQVSVTELKWALIEGPAKVTEIGMKQTQEEIDGVVKKKHSTVLRLFR